MTDRPFHNPFGALESLRGKLGADRPAAPESTPATASAPSPAGPPGKGPARAVVRIERSGRGGKDVTVVEHLGLSAAKQAEWLKALKAALGCGGVIEGDALVLQGDHRKRLPAILTARGVRRVTLG